MMIETGTSSAITREIIDLRDAQFGPTAAVVSTSLAPQSFMRLLNAWDGGRRLPGGAGRFW
jgi:hypothetical protein